MRWTMNEYNLDTRTQSPRLSWLRIMREYTQSSSSSRAGLGCFVEKQHHVKRVGTALRGQTMSLRVGLDAQVQDRAKCTRRGAGRSSRRRLLELSESKNLTVESVSYTHLTLPTICSV